MAKEKKYEPFIVKPILSRKCAVCGKWFDLCHPKDDRTLCEECRKVKTNEQDV